MGDNTEFDTLYKESKILNDAGKRYADACAYMYDSIDGAASEGFSDGLRFAVDAAHILIKHMLSENISDEICQNVADEMRKRIYDAFESMEFNKME